MLLRRPCSSRAPAARPPRPWCARPWCARHGSGMERAALNYLIASAGAALHIAPHCRRRSRGVGGGRCGDMIRGGGAEARHRKFKNASQHFVNYYVCVHAIKSMDVDCCMMTIHILLANKCDNQLPRAPLTDAAAPSPVHPAAPVPRGPRRAYNQHDSRRGEASGTGRGLR
jgi:hypothetical protein